jgi:hypothetical protein
MVIHNVHVYPISAGGSDGTNFLAESSKISGEYAGCDA